eukprot:GEZU01032498.1.p1 GENE.GEZU01032498.1~~GEZU01032498.1.p1  ORF type:complete len:640 (+),score=159.43 GEZU01032498.1:244-2163(+)
MNMYSPRNSGGGSSSSSGSGSGGYSQGGDADVFSSLSLPLSSFDDYILFSPTNSLISPSNNSNSSFSNLLQQHQQQPPEQQPIYKASASQASNPPMIYNTTNNPTSSSSSGSDFTDFPCALQFLPGESAIEFQSHHQLMCSPRSWLNPTVSSSVGVVPASHGPTMYSPPLNPITYPTFAEVSANPTRITLQQQQFMFDDTFSLSPSFIAGVGLSFVTGSATNPAPQQQQPQTLADQFPFSPAMSAMLQSTSSIPSTGSGLTSPQQQHHSRTGSHVVLPPQQPFAPALPANLRKIARQQDKSNSNKSASNTSSNSSEPIKESDGLNAQPLKRKVTVGNQIIPDPVKDELLDSFDISTRPFMSSSIIGHAATTDDLPSMMSQGRRDSMISVSSVTSTTSITSTEDEESNNHSHNNHSHNNNHEEGTKTTGQKQIKRVTTACINCRKAHSCCGKQRPCRRCVRLGLEATCVDIAGKKRGPKFKNPEEKKGRSRRRTKSAPAIEIPPSLALLRPTASSTTASSASSSAANTPTIPITEEDAAIFIVDTMELPTTIPFGSAAASGGGDNDEEIVSASANTMDTMMPFSPVATTPTEIPSSSSSSGSMKFTSASLSSLDLKEELPQPSPNTRSAFGLSAIDHYSA